MSKKIVYKYTLVSESGLQRVKVRVGQILDVQVQRNRVVLWVSTTPHAQEVEQTFLLVETGKAFSLPERLVFLKTLQLDNGDYVVHLFQEK